MLTVGKILRKARERKGLTYKEVSQATFIKPQYLEKIENDDFSDFKSPTFLKGFIRTYADYLELDVDKIMAIYRRQVNADEQPLKVYKRNVETRALVISPLHVAALVLLLFFIGVVAYMVKLYVQAGKPPELKIIWPETQETTVYTDKVEIKGIVEDNSIVKVNGEQVPLSKENTFKVEVSLQEGENLVEVEAYKVHLPDKKVVKKFVIFYEVKKKQEKKPEVKITKQRFTVTTTSDVWLQIIADNIQIDVGIKPSGYKKTFEAKNEVIVKSGRPAYTQFFMGDTKLNLPLQEAFDQGWTCTNNDGKWSCK